MGTMRYAAERRLTSINPEGLVATEKAALLTSILYQFAGQQLSTGELAMAVGLSGNGCWRMLKKLGRVLPIRHYPDKGTWVLNGAIKGRIE